MDNHQKKSYATTSGGGAFGMWEPSSNPIMFSVAQSNRGKNVGDGLDAIESQFQFSISQTAQDMASMEKLLNIPQDSVTCKIRAKRGFATHPRSIAERERRTRISGKLRKLQDLVPNMDKQTSYADMLDLAVQHIKTLQDQVEASEICSNLSETTTTTEGPSPLRAGTTRGGEGEAPGIEIVKERGRGRREREVGVAVEGGRRHGSPLHRRQSSSSEAPRVKRSAAVRREARELSRRC
uniref:Basic helix-loop-helix transcription factor n=1 Tax=Salvia miltiorrhiza TaxID=226208 RepID=A0A0H3Y910_SALMI|nr:basic helix-loop-helix transcription factor [Salvia miltiorrhiza]